MTFPSTAARPSRPRAPRVRGRRRSGFPLLPIFAGLLLALPLPAGEAHAQSVQAPARAALVIDNRVGVDTPEGVPGGREMAAALEAAGFTVRLLEQATERKMNGAFQAFLEALPSDAMAVVYYAGRAGLLKGRLVPIPDDFHPLGIVPTTDLNDWIAALANERPRSALWLLDAGFKAFPEPGTVRVQVPKGSCVVFADGLPGPPLEQGRFTEALLEAMRADPSGLPDLLRQARLRVVETSGGDQVPWQILNAPPEPWAGVLAPTGAR